MTKILAYFMLVLPSLALAQNVQIKSGSTIYIAPANGYETYLASAMEKKHLPLTITIDRDKADYIITSTVEQSQLFTPAIVVNNNVNANGSSAFDRGWQLGSEHSRSSGETSVSMALIEPRSSHVLFAYSVSKDRTHNLQSTAEACAKHLKEFMAKK